MERVGARFTDGVDDAAGGPPILGRVVPGDHGEFLNRIHAQVDSEDAARPAHGVVGDAVPIQPVIVLRGPAPGDGQLVPKAPVPANRAVLEGDLALDRVDAGNKGGQIIPAPAVEGHLENLFGINLGADRGRTELHQRRRFRHLDELSAFSDLH